MPKCRYCPRTIERPGPLARHEKRCALDKPAPSPEQVSEGWGFKAPPEPKADAADILMARLSKMEETLALLGKHVPNLPTGLLLTSKHAASYLTQFKANLEAGIKWCDAMLKMVNDQPAIDWRKEKGLDP